MLFPLKRYNRSKFNDKNSFHFLFEYEHSNKTDDIYALLLLFFFFIVAVVFLTFLFGSPLPTLLSLSLSPNESIESKQVKS